MRVLVVYAHPVETSFNAALHQAVLAGLRRAGHEVDDLDLYAEDFQPVLSRAERLDYHDTAINQRLIAPYVKRLQAAEAVVFVFPTWSFGTPAILKGFFDRVMIPGVSFALTEDGRAVPRLMNIKRIAAVVTYGRPWWLVRFAVGDLPRWQITRYFRRACAAGARATYHALYDMNRASTAKRQAFRDRVERAMAGFA
ncbi:MAG: NAD(P)H-dependent oxidoreductase [Alphaproteobacteria bacterium]|nr:NAD(P)H-dependent oxidoreductase [Alphaproteobacteria bacterium]